MPNASYCARLLILAASFLLISPSGAAETAITRGPYLQLTRHDGVSIVFRSAPLTLPRLEVTDAEGKPVAIELSLMQRDIASAEPLAVIPEGQVQYEFTVSGLQAATEYRYILFNGENSLLAEETLSFRTHPTPGKPTPARIWVVGDSGTGTSHQYLVHESMRRFVDKTQRPLDLYLHVGDMAYGRGTDRQFSEKFFRPYYPTLLGVTCWASLGNHEGQSSNGESGTGPFFDAYICPINAEAGGVASGSEAFYSFDFGDIHFICLDSYDVDRSPNGAMAQWLQKDLAACSARWRIAFWHHPPYSKGSHDSDTELPLVEMRKFIMPILEEKGVDLVLSGHSHIYERSMLIDGAYVTPTTAEGVILDDGDGHPEGDGAYKKPEEATPHAGTIAIVTGHGGALAAKEKGVLPIMRSLVLDHGSTLLDVDGDTLTGIMLDLRGEERDRFSIVKKGNPPRQVVDQPWTPTAADVERTGHGVINATQSKSGFPQVFGEGNPALTVPANTTPIIPLQAEWSYLAGGQKPSRPNWDTVAADLSDWKTGTAGFGYGDGDDNTEIDDMRGKYTQLFIRKEFTLPPGTDLQQLGLVIHYDDAFTVSLNGILLFSKHLTKRKSGEVVNISGHEAEVAEFFSLAAYAHAFREGQNVIAFEGHNVGLKSSDFSLHPSLVKVPPTTKKVPPQ